MLLRLTPRRKNSRRVGETSSQLPQEPLHLPWHPLQSLWHPLTCEALVRWSLPQSQPLSAETTWGYCKRQKGQGTYVAAEAFAASCENGHMVVASWLVAVHGVENVDALARCWYCACRRGHAALAKWLYTLGPAAMDISRGLEEACLSGHAGMAKWLSGLGVVQCDPTRRPEISLGLPGTIQRLHAAGYVHLNGHFAFGSVCRQGYLPDAQWLLAKGVHIKSLEHIFVWLLADYRAGIWFRVFKWLIKLGVDMHCENDVAFKTSCRCRRVPYIRHLVSQDPHWDWPEALFPECLTWSRTRGAWIQACVLETRAPESMRANKAAPS